MSERIISPATYGIVLAALLVLTGFTLAVSFIPLEGAWHIIFGLLFAVCKGTLVLLFFMHALYSPRWTWLAIGAGVFWLLILLSLTLSDYFGRGLLPFPGH
jgi:cytochrome c oxidase subunit 4